MSLLTIIWSMLSAAGFIIGLVHLLVWLYDRGRLVHLAASIMAIGAGAQALGELGLMKATTLDGLPGMLVVGNYVIAVVLVSMVWFVHLLLGTGRRPLLWLITGLWTVCSVINAFSPNSLTYISLEGLETGTTFWGENFAMIRGATNPLKWLAELTSLLIMVFVADASVQAWRAGRRQRGIVVGGSVLGFILAAGIHTPLVDAGVVKTPFMISVAFLGIVLALSQQLARETARALVYARELEAGQQRWNSLLTGVRLAVLDVGPDGLVRYVNPFFCRVLGLEADQVTTRPMLSLVTRDQRGEARRRFAEAVGEKGPRPRSRWTMEGRDGDRTFDWSAVQLLTPDGAVDGILAIGADVTTELEASADLEDTRQELDRVMRSNILGEFVSAMAHELHQPLAAILANARSAERYLEGERPRTDEAREVIELIVRDDKRAATVLQGLRNMMTRGEVVREIFDLHPALEEVLVICGPELRAEGIELEVGLAPGSPRVEAGRVEIQQVALNLLRNAVRALGEQGGDGRKIRVGSRLEDGQVVVVVEDNGPGIAADRLETIFAPFNGGGGQGLGMGLAICRRIIESHGGTIEARQVDRGARLSFTLPEAKEAKVRASEM